MIEPLSDEFDGLAERVWLNCAHQGPLPRCAADAARAAIDEKRQPWRMEAAEWAEQPRRLRRSLAGVLGASPDDIVLANSASYGLELLARTLPLERGDEVLLVDGDFPATVYPWLALRARGVELRLLPNDEALTPARLAEELGPRTRVLCASWVFSFTGRAVDLTALGETCRQHGVTYIVNATQGVGARSLAVDELPIDALVCSGFKWLCGPYGTGFAWLDPALRARLTYAPAYWLTHQLASAEGLDRSPRYELADVGAAAYDIPDTANFVNFRAWEASIDLIAGIGISRVEQHDLALAFMLSQGLEHHGFAVRSPRPDGARSAIVVASHPDEARNGAIFESLREAGIDVAMRTGALRFSPHLYNGEADVERALAALAN